MEAESADCESLRTKYQKIRQILHKNYLKPGDFEEFLHGEHLHKLHKTQITSKIKKILSEYKQAIDLDKSSGGEKS